jgi:urease accessory protein
MIRRNTMTTAALAAFMTLAASAAMAHAGHDHVHGSGLGSGLLHPVTGLDHLLAMLAVGLWAGRLGGRMRWGLPLAFVGAMLAGCGLAMAGLGLPLVEPGIAASVLVLGLALAAAVKVPAGAGLAAVAVFAVFHGHAHGAEIAEGASTLAYMAGFSFTTAALHAAGLGLAVAIASLGRSEERATLVTRLGGGAVATCGALMMVGVL